MYIVVDSLLVLKGYNENFFYTDVILAIYNFYEYDVNFQPKSKHTKPNYRQIEN